MDSARESESFLKAIGLGALIWAIGAAIYGVAEVLVNNVGGSAPGDPVSMSEEVWDAQIDHNLKTAFLGCKHVLPVMEQQGSGAIVNISSVAALSHQVGGRVNVVNWPMSRLLVSYFGSFYARAITRLPVRDATGGFNCFRREVLEALDLGRIQANGYAPVGSGRPAISRVALPIAMVKPTESANARTSHSSARPARPDAPTRRAR